MSGRNPIIYKTIKANTFVSGFGTQVSASNTFFAGTVQNINAGTFNMKPILINQAVTFIKNNAPTYNIINLSSPKIIDFDKISTTNRQLYLVGASRNVYRSVPTVFLPADDSNYLTDTLSIPSSFFTEDKELVVVPFTFQMKYVGILEQCNDDPNTVIEGRFTVKKEDENTYSLSSWKILSVDYNSNDFCSDELNPYYFYDECKELDDDECIEQNIWDKLTEMFENAVVELNTNNSPSTVDVILSIDTFHDKIKNMLGTYTLINSNDESILTFIFNTNSTVIAEITSVENKKVIPVLNDKIELQNLTSGTTIEFEFISGNRSGLVSSFVGNFVKMSVNTLNPDYE